MGAGTTRIGGLFGVASAIVVIPVYLVGSPEVPSRAEDVRTYYEDASSFLTANGTLHLLFGMLFLGVLVSVLRSAAGPTGAPIRRLPGWVSWVCCCSSCHQSWTSRRKV